MATDVPSARRSGGLRARITAILHLHSHGDHVQSTAANDPLLATDAGIRTVWIAFFALSATALLQLVVVWLSSSVALLADTVHNIGDSLNSLPLLLALYIGRRAATRRYTYGFGRAEDIAGVLIVLSIAFSAGVILWQSGQKLLDPQPIQQPLWVAFAALIGFFGNELVALLQIRTGRRIGSEAMVADGLHARIDGLTSLAVLVAVVGSVLGAPILDPLVGLVIGVIVLGITRDAAQRIWRRIMDAVDPQLVDRIEQLAGEAAEVIAVETVRARWVGHTLFATVVVRVPETLALAESHVVAERIRAQVAASLRYTLVVDVVARPDYAGAAETISARADAILPQRYQGGVAVSAAPMGAAALTYDADGAVAWDDVWTGYCELALAGGPPHRATLLEPVASESVAIDPAGYARVVAEIRRGLELVTARATQLSTTPGWVGLVCDNEAMALWLLRAIVVENITVRREDAVLYLPAGPAYRLEREIKSIVTVVAKTAHYWTEHARSMATT